jgi:hypothetical protein
VSGWRVAFVVTRHDEAILYSGKICVSALSEVLSASKLDDQMGPAPADLRS